MPHVHTIEISKWAFIHMDFMGFCFKDFQMTSPQLTMTFFNMDFELVLKGLISD